MKTRLGIILKEKHMSGSELARRMGVTPAYINQCVLGTANVSLRQLEKISSILETPIAAFFEGYTEVEKQFYCPHCGAPIKISISKA